MNTPKVSVIIPTYNRSKLLREAVISVLNQTFTDYEIIVVDDGSTDDTAEVVASIASTKLTYIFQENRGRSNARNHALAKAQGDYIAYLDSDDLFTPEKLEKQISVLDANPDFGMTYTSARVIDENGTEIFRPGESDDTMPYYRATESGWIYDKIAFYLPLTVLLPTVMVRRNIMETVGGFDENLDRFEDTDMWRRISKVTKIFAINEPLCTVRTHSGNKMERPEKLLQSVSTYVAKIRDEDGGETPAWRKGGALLFLHYGLAVKASRDYEQYAFDFFKNSIRVSARIPVEYFSEHSILTLKESLILAMKTYYFDPLIVSRYIIRSFYISFRNIYRTLTL